MQDVIYNFDYFCFFRMWGIYMVGKLDQLSFENFLCVSFIYIMDWKNILLFVVLCVFEVIVCIGMMIVVVVELNVIYVVVV